MGVQRVIDITRYQFEPPGYYTVHDVLTDYSRERLIAKGKDCQRAWAGFNWFMDVVDAKQEAVKIQTGQIEDYIDYRVGLGATLTTVKRELTFVKAALHNAFRRNRIAQMPYFEVPDGSTMKVRRPLTEPEFRLVIAQPMSQRLNHFYWSAYYTGHRSRAIEEWEWDRVDFVRRLINFNVPGRLLNNKKRAAAFPIPDDFLPMLLEWKAKATSKYVIGVGTYGRCSSTYHEANYVVRELAGLKDPTLVPRHCMRKMFATELIDRMIAKTGQADMETVGYLMADRPDTVRKHYLQHKEATLRDAVNLRARESL